MFTAGTLEFLARFARPICLVIGYLCGSFLTAEVVSKAWAKTSVFELGDGNPGMANVGHELGLQAALICLAGDILKTLAAVMMAHALFPQMEGLATLWAGFGSTLGHSFPFWHHFKGGKGVTTISTTIILAAPLWGVAAGIVAVATIVLSGYLSVGAIVGITFYTLAMFFTKPFEYALVSFAFVLLSLFCHWSKLVGISKGTTHRASLSTKFWAKVRGK